MPEHKTKTAEPHDLNGLRCVVLGGGGFIGTNLCRELVRRNARVRAYGAHSSFPDALEQVEWTGGSFDDHDALAQVVAGSEAVFHLIGGSVPAKSNLDPIGDLKMSVVNTLALLDLCRRHGVRKVIFASSGGTVYGIPQQTPIAETHPTEPISAYGVSKLTAEKYLALYGYLHGVDYCVLRVANPFGPYQIPVNSQGVVCAVMHKALCGEPVEIWGDGEVVRDFIFISDVVDAMIRAVDYQGPHHVFNVGSGAGRSINQIVADTQSALDGRPVETVYKASRPADVPTNVLDISLIEREMGWRPQVAWMDGLRRTAAWMAQSLPRNNPDKAEI